MTTALTGACGEHYVAAYLSDRGLLVALPRAGVKVADLFVADPECGYPLRVQVKTGTDSHRKNKGVWSYEWQMSLPKEQHCNESTWYAFVYLNGWPVGAALPEVAFIPSAVVLARMKSDRVDGKEPSWSSFWMLDEEIKPYLGDEGFKLLQQFLLAPKTSAATPDQK